MLQNPRDQIAAPVARSSTWTRYFPRSVSSTSRVRLPGQAPSIRHRSTATCSSVAVPACT
jgi:hypothetical protein